MIFRKIFEEEMNEIINQIEELKQMQQFPRYYLSKYFEELKTQVDTKYALKLDEKGKYLEIINRIESFKRVKYKFGTFTKQNKTSRPVNARDNLFLLFKKDMILFARLITRHKYRSIVRKT